jgi:methyl-accepting chemotaxis protein
MKNLRISLKLIVGFLIATMLTVIVGGIGIYGLVTSADSNTEMYNDVLLQTTIMSDIVKTIQLLRYNAGQYLVYVFQEDVAGIEETNNIIEGYKNILSDNLNALEVGRDDAEIQTILERERYFYENGFKNHLTRVYQMAKDFNLTGIVDELLNVKSDVDGFVDGFNHCKDLKIESARSANEDNKGMTQLLLIVIITVLVLSVIISMLLAFYISRLIGKPITLLSAFMKKAGSTGDISLSPEDIANIGEMGKVNDEIGQTISNSALFVGHIADIANELESISNGDLSVDIKLISDADLMGRSLKHTVESLNNMFGNIYSSTSQVSVGAKQVADGAQSLAQGSTEQAASIQQLSGSIAQIAEKTKENAEIAEKASKLSNSIKDSAEKGSAQMDEMIMAVKEINEASQSISKIIKTIDDIAFQTNILALNAAVEAARAGQHGKGFAVVAEEVRNLASKSAEAAKDTGNMIQNSMAKADLGSQIANETATSLKDIVSGINESSELVKEIARSSEEQSLGISQINIGIDQVAQVVQQNSATAEQSAAASEEMSSQSSMLEELISQFKLKESDAGYRGLPPAKRSARLSPVASRVGVGMDDFGKY